MEFVIPLPFISLFLLYSSNHHHAHSLPSPADNSFSPTSVVCGPSTCGSITVKYPFGLLDGCGASQFRNMLNCSIATAELFFITPSGTYKVQSINYIDKVMTIYDPRMSTCSVLQPHHDFLMTEVQYAIIPPSPDTIFILLNCSFDSPLLHHYSSLCFNISPDSCNKLYSTCHAFTPFNYNNNNTNSSSTPSRCFTGYNTLKYMSMNMLDCSHYTTVYGTNDDDLRGVTPLDWKYGISLSYSVADTGCEACEKSSGTCGFDTETEGGLCICSNSLNSTRQCAIIDEGGEARSTATFMLFQAFALLLMFIHVY